jgi:glycosyltransferase involved in cell wall biosynthesis
MNKTRVLFCGTHIQQYNGYSKIIYEILHQLGDYNDLEITLFGFQNFYKNKHHSSIRKLNDNIVIFDPFKYESLTHKFYEDNNSNNNQIKSMLYNGFGPDYIKDVISLVRPNIVIIYNDPGVIVTLYKSIFNIKELNNGQFNFSIQSNFKDIKFIPYLDVVYKNMSLQHLQIINQLSYGIIYFAQYWKNVSWHFNEKNNLNKYFILNHGFNHHNYYPVDYDLACKLMNMDNKSFKILNLNRNQPRKQLDIGIRAYIKFLSKENYINENIYFIHGTNIDESWNILEIIEYECLDLGLDFKKVLSKFKLLNKPQQYTDLEINLLYNICDIGINCCNGEGFGLIPFEHSAIMKPNIISNVGPISDIFDDNSAIIINHVAENYISHTGHPLSGICEYCDYNDFANAIEKYYNNKELRELHGKNARKNILENYKWDKLINKFHDYLIKVTNEK